MLRLVPEVIDHLEAHHGIVSLDVLRDAGYSSAGIKQLVRAGVLELVLHGAYRLRGHRLTRLGRLAAVCTAHPGVAIAGRSAGELWGFRRMPPVVRVAVDGDLVEPVHVIAAPGSHPTVKRWVSVYRTAAIHWETDVVVRPDGIRVTDRPRTALDLARDVRGLDLLSIIEQAMHDGGHDPTEMRAVAADWQSPRRRWLDEYLHLVDRTLPGAPAESHPEVRLGAALAAGGLYGIERQYPLDLPGHGAIRFDLAVPRLRWAIEVDLFPTHHETAGRLSDEARDRACHALGWTITRLGPRDLAESFDATVDRLLALAARLEQPAV